MAFTTFVEQAIAGGCVSFTVTVNEQLAWFPLVSVAVQVTVVVPFGKVAPLAGLHTTEHEATVGLPLTGAPTPHAQLSLATDVIYVTTAAQRFGSVGFVMFAGHMIVGGCVSFTVTVKLQAESGGMPLAAVQLTVVLPF